MLPKEITLAELEKYIPVAEHAKRIIVHELVTELKLQAPSRFLLVARNGMVWLIVVMNPLALGTTIRKYHNPQVAHQISTAFAGKPVFIAKKPDYAMEFYSAKNRSFLKKSCFRISPKSATYFILVRPYKAK